ncbi:M23 family metallopeptidase [Desulfurispira natronophila]|uniref:Murein DD-endopeptidase MepM/ murein hydrolase activator NlpD n=1 Tax=Desulfurispira natronophila TaxID=682562 RepID=A0A7W7Y540_9BACT|nr:M23 family metallopeptidase [Desulfurispira natronophila]MBB5022162.1 murein DD-endopeptidase MepM/ murein hydrolase activator NlpD [Desulfurispira natronophila]
MSKVRQSIERHRKQMQKRFTSQPQVERYIYLSTSSGRGGVVERRKISRMAWIVFIYLLLITIVALYFIFESKEAHQYSYELNEKIAFLNKTVSELEGESARKGNALDLVQLQLQESHSMLNRYREELSQYVLLNENFVLQGGAVQRVDDSPTSRAIERELTFARTQLQKVATRVLDIEDQLGLSHSSSVKSASQLTVDDVYAKIDSVQMEIGVREDLAKELPVSFPTEGRITSRYGARVHPITGRPSFHAGYDIANVEGTPIYTPAPGVVSRAGYDNLAGNYLEIRHQHGFTTRYIHLSERLVERGDKVLGGQKIAEMGNTGRSTASHLHYEVHYKGRHVDPRSFLYSSILNLHTFFSYPEVKWRYSQLNEKHQQETTLTRAN